MLSGFTLSYQGRKFSPDAEQNQTDELNGLAKLKSSFSEIGALVIRFHIGQGQRVGLLQQIARHDYLANPVEKPAHGGNQDDLFTTPDDASSTCHETRMLEECSHYSLGRGKLLNERGQPLMHINTKDFRGEQTMWDIMHSPVWGTGIGLSYELSKQGFIYVIHPQELSDARYAQISNELIRGEFDIIKGDDGIVIRTQSGMTLETALFQSLKISTDPAKLRTQQENGLLISVNDKEAPLGWMIHAASKRLIASDIADHMLRVIRIAKGGFYELAREEQMILQMGLLRNNGLGLFTQNQAFNAMEYIFQMLEKEYGFDPSKLLPDKALHTAYTRIADLTQHPDKEAVEDFLTGILITEMVQHLKRTQTNSTRTSLPLRFTNRFEVILNNAKAIAYAFDIKTRDGIPVLQQQEHVPAVSHDDGLLDVRVNGRLLNPELVNPKHTASLLATALLVAEQMMVEQLLRDAVHFGDDHPNAKALKSILANGEVYQLLIKMAKQLPQNAQGPILGLQFSYCDDVVQLMRETLHFDGKHLAGVVQQLYRGDEKAIEIDDAIITSGLLKLVEIGECLQQLDGITVREQQSRGINAGLLLVVEKLAPSLYQKLIHQGRVSAGCGDAPCKTAIDDADNADVCPYLSAKRKAVVASPAEHKPMMPAREAKKSDTWCGYFAKVAVPVSVGLAIAAIAVSETYFL